jgi:cation transport ATPase
MDKVDVLITDKTGTLTQGKPSVETVFSQRGNADDLLQKIASLNQYSEHPLASKSATSTRLIFFSLANCTTACAKGCSLY